MSDAEAIIDRLDSISGRLAEGVRDRSFATLILALFAVAGLGVTAAGIFSLVAFVVARRTREIAVRIALGATAGHVRSVVLRSTALAALSGGAVGLAGGLTFVTVLRSQLYGVEAGDVPTLATTAIGFVLLTSVAAWWPARRAVRLNPMLALRVE